MQSGSTARSLAVHHTPAGRISQESPFHALLQTHLPPAHLPFSEQSSALVQPGVLSRTRHRGTRCAGAAAVLVSMACCNVSETSEFGGNSIGAVCCLPPPAPSSTTAITLGDTRVGAAGELSSSLEADVRIDPATCLKPLLLLRSPLITTLAVTEQFSGLTTRTLSWLPSCDLDACASSATGVRYGHGTGGGGGFGGDGRGGGSFLALGGASAQSCCSRDPADSGASTADRQLSPAAE